MNQLFKDFATFFYFKYISYTDGKIIEKKELQKLLFYSQSLFYTKKNRFLFQENIEVRSVEFNPVFKCIEDNFQHLRSIIYENHRYDYCMMGFVNFDADMRRKYLDEKITLLHNIYWRYYKEPNKRKVIEQIEKEFNKKYPFHLHTTAGKLSDKYIIKLGKELLPIFEDFEKDLLLF